MATKRSLAQSSAGWNQEMDSIHTQPLPRAPPGGFILPDGTADCSESIDSSDAGDSVDDRTLEALGALHDALMAGHADGLIDSLRRSGKNSAWHYASHIPKTPDNEEEYLPMEIDSSSEMDPARESWDEVESEDY